VGGVISHSPLSTGCRSWPGRAQNRIDGTRIWLPRGSPAHNRERGVVAPLVGGKPILFITVCVFPWPSPCGGAHPIQAVDVLVWPARWPASFPGCAAFLPEGKKRATYTRRALRPTRGSTRLVQRFQRSCCCSAPVVCGRKKFQFSRSKPSGKLVRRRRGASAKRR